MSLQAQKGTSAENTQLCNTVGWRSPPPPCHEFLLQGVGFLDNDDLEGFGPENYVIYSGLDTATSPVLGVYEVFVSLYVGSSEWWRLTARASGEVVWVEEGSYADVRGTSSSYGTYEYASDTFTYTVAEYDPRCGGVA